MSAELARRIESLRAAGADRWDAPAFAMLVSLQARAARTSGDAGRKFAWALDRCEALEEWMDGARRTLADVAPPAGDSADRDPVQGALDAGDLPSAQVLAVLAQLRPQLTNRAPRALAIANADRFEESLLDARTAVVSAQVHAVGTEPTGPYNPTALAAQLLARVDDLAPTYLRACVAALHDLATLQHATSEPVAPKPRRSRPPRSKPANAARKNE
jgi:hypothetical protein